MTDFQELLKTDFAWPRKGDIPFIPSAEGVRGAHIDQDSHTRLISMMTGYKEGADLLVVKAQETGYLRDALVYPIIFNYRQFIELSLKYIIYAFGHTVGIPANWKSHDIAFLWSEFVKVQDAYGADDVDQTNPIVAKIIAQFAKIDPDSFAFRYPMDKDGKLIPLGIDELDLATLAKVMDGVEAYFSGCDGYLDHLQGASP
jgi:hypothetical protein